MPGREDNYSRRVRFIDSECNSRKYTYLTEESSGNVTQFDRRTNVLQTISEEAISEDKGSVTNRMELQSEREKMLNMLSQRYINQNIESEYLPLSEIPIKSARSAQNTPQTLQNIETATKTATGFQKKHNNTSKQPIYIQIGKTTSSLNTYYIDQNTPPPLTPYTKPSFCRQCETFSIKIQQLQNSYGLLLSAKNQQLQDCKIIIDCLEEKLLTIEKRSQQELQRSRKMRMQFEKKNLQQAQFRGKESEMMEYLKNREIVLMEQIKELENQMFINKIKTKQFNKTKKQSTQSTKNYLTKKSSSKSNPVNLVNFPSYAQMEPFCQQQQQQEKLKESHLEHSGSEYSANTYKSEIHSQKCDKSLQVKTKFNSIPKQPKIELIQKTPITDIHIRNNQIQSLKDDLLISELKTKIQQTKNLQTLYLIR